MLRGVFILSIVFLVFHSIYYFQLEPPLTVGCVPFDPTGKNAEQISIASATCANTLAAYAIENASFDMLRARAFISAKWCAGMAFLTGYLLWRLRGGSAAG